MVLGVLGVVLNAFRHQGKNHHEDLVERVQRVRAQRLSASRQESRPQRAAVGLAQPVLNAFRHQGKNHASVACVNVVLGFACSTPFGIKARITRWPTDHDRPGLECSTPFGIKARITDQGAAAAADAGGACSTPFGIKARITMAGHLFAKRLRGCSTPFGIKARITHHQAERNDHHADVLNAFRHQGKNHRCGRSGQRPRREVLNAFRHQGKNHQRTVSRITAQNEVLNAFRHQGKNHLQLIGTKTARNKRCSTPFGIKARITLRRLLRLI